VAGRSIALEPKLVHALSSPKGRIVHASRRIAGRAEDREALEEQFCEGLEDTFPASDPVSVVDLISGRCNPLAGTEERLRTISEARNCIICAVWWNRFEMVPRERLLQDPRGDASGWTFRTLEHDAHGTDTKGRSYVYVVQKFDGVFVQWKSGDSTNR
jgi:hypothetical protein